MIGAFCAVSLPQLRMRVACYFVKDMLKGDDVYEIRLELKEVLHCCCCPAAVPGDVLCGGVEDAVEVPCCGIC